MKIFPHNNIKLVILRRDLFVFVFWAEANTFSIIAQINGRLRNCSV